MVIALSVSRPCKSRFKRGTLKAHAWVTFHVMNDVTGIVDSVLWYIVDTASVSISLNYVH